MSTPKRNSLGQFTKRRTNGTKTNGKKITKRKNSPTLLANPKTGDVLIYKGHTVTFSKGKYHVTAYKGRSFAKLKEVKDWLDGHVEETST